MAASEPAAGLPEGLRLERLDEGDLPNALRLSVEAGWNQVAADWRIFLELGDAFGLKSGDDHLLATAAMLPEGERVAWVSMVVVTAAWRGRGLARWLLRYCVELLGKRRLVPALDATPAGRAVYLGLGFRDCWRLRRLVLQAPLRLPATATNDARVRRITASDWPALLAFDRALAGIDRGPVLRRLAARLPAAALLAERRGDLAGFVLGRDGRVMSQLGPLAAADDAAAQALLAHAFAAVSAPLAIDLRERHAGLADWLTALGFAVERPYTRMVLADDVVLADDARDYAIAGPELG